jgi:hypothetical protein
MTAFQQERVDFVHVAHKAQVVVGHRLTAHAFELGMRIGLEFLQLSRRNFERC